MTSAVGQRAVDSTSCSPILAGARHAARVRSHYRTVPHWVRTATLVDPRVTDTFVAPPHDAVSSSRTKIRLPAGSHGTLPEPVTKIPNVGVSWWFITRVTLGAGGARHALVAGFVSQMDSATGMVTPPASADTTIVPPAPAFVVATAKNPVPARPGMFTIPSLLWRRGR